MPLHKCVNSKGNANLIVVIIVTAIISCVSAYVYMQKQVEKERREFQDLKQTTQKNTQQTDNTKGNIQPSTPQQVEQKWSTYTFNDLKIKYTFQYPITWAIDREDSQNKTIVLKSKRDEIFTIATISGGFGMPCMTLVREESIKIRDQEIKYFINKDQAHAECQVTNFDNRLAGTVIKGRNQDYLITLNYSVTNEKEAIENFRHILSTFQVY